VGFSTKRCLLVALVSSASLFLARLLPAKIAAVALSAVAMRADAEDGFTRIAASWTKQELRHVLDDKPPLRFGDDAEDSLSNRRVIKKPRFSMRGDITPQFASSRVVITIVQVVRIKCDSVESVATLPLRNEQTAVVLSSFRLWATLK
jgi:hypothetical protein